MGRLSVLAVSLASLLCLAPNALAGTVNTAKVEDITLGNNEFYFDLVGLPDMCNSALNKKVAKVDYPRLSQETVRLMHSTLVSAKLAGRSVTVYTLDNPAGDCLVRAIVMK